MDSAEGPGAHGGGGPLAVVRRGSLSLDQCRQLGRNEHLDALRSGWRVLIYRDAYEATVTLVARHRLRRSAEEPVTELESVDFETGEIEVVEIADDDPWARTNAQAAAASRRYFVANRLRYMWVLTYDPDRVTEEQRHRRAFAMAATSLLARKLRRLLGRKVPYWYSPELHPGGHGWHVNLFVAERLAHSELESLWALGFVWVTDFERSPRAPHGEPLGLCRTPQDAWRRAARYGCKYAQKDWSEEHLGRMVHRYEVAQGFAPEVVRRWVNSKREADALVRKYLPEAAGGHVSVWDSMDSESWKRPAAMVYRW